MKIILTCLVIFWSSLSFANKPTYDYVILQNGKHVQGQVINIGKNHIKINVDTNIKFIKSKNILGVTFDQELTPKENIDLDFLMAKGSQETRRGIYS